MVFSLSLSLSLSLCVCVSVSVSRSFYVPLLPYLLVHVPTYYTHHVVNPDQLLTAELMDQVSKLGVDKDKDPELWMALLLTLKDEEKKADILQEVQGILPSGWGEGGTWRP